MFQGKSCKKASLLNFLLVLSFVHQTNIKLPIQCNCTASVKDDNSFHVYANISNRNHIGLTLEHLKRSHSADLTNTFIGT